MGIVVQTNVPSLIAQNSLTKATNSMNQAMERMTTGYKINSAKDDAAGLYVATSLDKNIRGSKIAQQNVQMGNDLLAVAESDLAVIQDNLLRIRDLSLTAANGIYEEKSLAAIQAEVDARLEEIDRVAGVSEYNGKKLLATDAPKTITLQVGANTSDNDKIIVKEGVLGDATAETLGISTKTSDAFTETGVAPGTDGAPSTLDTFIGEVDTALATVQTRRSDIGALQSRLDSTAASLTTTVENLSASKSTIMDADIAAESSKYISAQILQEAATSLLSQANQAPQIALSLI